MFILSCLEDDVRVAPQELGIPTEDAIMRVLEKTLIDKVIKDLGVVITIYDIINIGEGSVYHSDGGAHYKVTFNVVVFKPFIGETLQGKIKDMDESGITVSLGFFHDIRIPEDLLPNPSKYHTAEGDWAWHMEGQDPLYFERGLDIRLKVHAIRFNTLPTLQSQQQQREAGMPVDGTEDKPFVPMQIIGKADGDGLGMVHWYQ